MREIFKARELVKKHCCTPRIKLPINLMQICKGLGIVVRCIEIPNFDGCHLRFKEDRRVLIILNKKLHKHRKRFTIAHEIGHISMGHMPSYFNGESFIEARYRWQEAQANRFASELLMPWPILKQFGMLSAYEMSEKFEVSFDAATIKAQQLGWVGQRLKNYWKQEIEEELDRMFGPRKTG